MTSSDFIYLFALRFSKTSKRDAWQNLLEIQPQAEHQLFWPAVKCPIPGSPVQAGTRRNLISRANLLGPLWVRDIHRKPDAKPAIPGAQQHTVSINSLFFQLWCVQVWQSSLLDDFHPPISSHLSASLLVRDESVGKYFCLLAFTFSVTGSFMHSDLCCSASMLHHIHSAMSNNKVDEISQQKILLKGLLHARHSVLFNHEARQTSKGAQPHHAVDGRIYLVKLKDSLVLLFLWEFQ